MKHPYIPLGCTQQDRVQPTLAQTHRHLDPEALLASGALAGPYRKPHPITRWRQIGQRISTALAALARAL